MLNKVDNKTPGHKNSISLEPYLKWVWARAQKLVMPYPSILLVIVEPVVEGDVPYTILHQNMPTSLEDLKKGWVQLKEERDTFEAQFYASEKRILELTKKLQEEKSVNAYLAPKRIHGDWRNKLYCWLRHVYYNLGSKQYEDEPAHLSQPMG